MNSLKKIFSANAVILIILFLSDFAFPQTRIALLYSGYTENKSENPKTVLEEITSWELFLMESNVSYKVIYDEDLESGIEDDFDVLILPSVDFISAEELESLKQFQLNEKSIISVGSKLFVDNNYENNFNNIELLFGITKLKTVEPNVFNIQHTLNVNEINKFNFDKAGSIQISNRNEIIVYKTGGDLSIACGYVIENSIGELNSSICFGNKNRAKFLWTGFGINDLVGGKADIKKFNDLILSTIKWMDNNIDAFVNLPLDENKKPALVLIEKNNALESELLEVLNKDKIEYHLVNNSQIKITDCLIAKTNPENMILDLTQFVVEQNSTEKLKSMILDIESILVQKIKSVFVNDELTSDEYLKILNENGIKNIFVNSNFNSEPKLVNLDQLLIPISKTHSKHLSNYFYPLYYTPKYNCEEDSEDSLLTMINKLKKNNYVFVNINQYRKWFTSNDNLSVKNISQIENGIDITVWNNNTTQINKAKLYLDSFNQNEYNNISFTSGSELLKTTYNSNTGFIEIEIGNLFAKSNKKIVIRFNNE